MRLDNDYANAPFIPGAEGFIERWKSQAAAFRADLLARDAAQLDIAYGQSERQRFDLFLPENPPKGLFVFVHGGYWLRFDKSDWSHFAQGPLAHGWAVAMPSYDLCPRVSIAQITRQISQAIVQSAARIAGPLILAGHSAGGHLVARMACADGLPQALHERIKRVLAISPLADLRPLMETSMNADFKLDSASARDESPVFAPKPDLDVRIWVGGAERPVFLQQAAWLGSAWHVVPVIPPKCHHFDIIDALKDPEHNRLFDVLA